MATSSSFPVKINFKVKKGDTFRRILTFQTKGDNPQNVDQTGAQFKLIIEGEDDLTLGDGLSLQGVDNHQVLISKDIDFAGSRKCEFERLMNGVTKTWFQGIIKSQDELLEE